MITFEQAMKDPDKYKDRYKVFLYRKGDKGRTISKKVGPLEASEMLNSDMGWTRFPGDLIKSEKDSPVYKVVKEIGKYRNVLAQLYEADESDKPLLIDLEFNLFGTKSPVNIGLKKLQDKIFEAAKESGIIDEI